MSALDVEPPRSTRGLGSEDIVPIVESVLRAAMDRLDAEAAAARAEANAVVSAAVQRSADLVLATRASRAPAAPCVEEPAVDVVIDLGRTTLPDPPPEALGPEVGMGDEAQVYDLFWSEIPADQPIRERLRRWAQRPPI